LIALIALIAKIIGPAIASEGRGFDNVSRMHRNRDGIVRATILGGWDTA
jgi:hypothetical protein